MTDFPADIKEQILCHLGASSSDIKNQVDTALRGLSRLDMTHQLYHDLFPHDNIMRHVDGYNNVSKEIAKLIHMKGYYEPITKDFDHVPSCIGKLNGVFTLKQNKAEIASIKDMITNLESYKITPT